MKKKPFRDSIESSELPSDLKPHYFEILFSFDFAESYINEIISEIISDEISKKDEAIEYLNKENIEIIESRF